MFIKVLMCIILIGSLTGCATTKKKAPTGQLEIRVANIENQLDGFDQDISDLRTSVDDLSLRVKHISVVKQQSSPTKTVVKSSSPKTTVTTIKNQNILRVPVAPKEVQGALKSAGYYQGSIDGKLGAQSKKAIKEFQSDHDLVSDGIVGKKTWAELKNYVE